MLIHGMSAAFRLENKIKESLNQSVYHSEKDWFISCFRHTSEGLLQVGDVNTVLSIHAIAFLINVFSMSLRVEKI